MSKFGKFDEKETKKGNVRRIVSRCLERMKHDHVRICEDEKTEEVIKILSELLTEKEAKDLLSIANYGKIVEKGEDVEYSDLEDKFWEFNDKNSDYEKFLKSFYYEVLPTVMIEDFHGFGEVKNDFLRYFILWDNFANKKKMIIGWIPEYSFETANKNVVERLENFNNIKNGQHHMEKLFSTFRFFSIEVKWHLRVIPVECGNLQLRLLNVIP